MNELKNIGRRITFKYCLIGFIGISLIPVFTLLYLLLFKDTPLNIAGSLEEARQNAVLLMLQVAIVLLAIYFWGAKAGVGIIASKKSPFWTSFGSIVAIWLSLLLGSAITGGLLNSIQFGYSGFESAFLSWLFYGFVVFMSLGVLHGFIAAIWMGKEIVEKGKKTK